MDKTNKPEWESPGQTAGVIGVCRASVYGLIGEGKLDARKLNGRTPVNVASRRTLMDGLPNANIATRNPPPPRPVPQPPKRRRA